jgi:hypothetical protein
VQAQLLNIWHYFVRSNHIALRKSGSLTIDWRLVFLSRRCVWLCICHAFHLLVDLCLGLPIYSELIEGNLTDAVTDIVNGINAVKQNAPQAAQEAKTATGT